MPTKLFWLAAIILPVIMAVCLRFYKKTEDMQGVGLQCANFLSAVIGAACGIGWITATVSLVNQAYCAEGSLSTKLGPLLLCWLMAMVAEIIVPSDKDRPLPRTPDQRIENVEARMQTLESTVNALQETEPGKEQTNGTN